MGVLIVVAILAIIVVIFRNSQTKTPKAPSFTVAVVGFEKAGKTVFLGSMYYQLRVPGSDGISIGTSPDRAGKLLDLYQRTANTQADFPNATAKGDITEWPFSIRVTLPGAVPEVAEFSYLDFAGETFRDLYTATPHPITQDLHARFTRADILMGMLDGAEVKRYLEGRPREAFLDDLGTLFSLLSENAQPKHLILTKWDILEDHFTFRQLVERLFQLDSFARFVGSQAIANGTCRLIPVSSVGKGFVREEGDRMVKEPGKPVQPTGMDRPLACSIPDVISTAQRAALQQPKWSRASSLLDWVSVSVGPVKIDLHDPQAPYGLYGDEQTAAELRQRGQGAALLLQYCSRQVQQLVQEFPESDLVRFRRELGM